MRHVFGYAGDGLVHAVPYRVWTSSEEHNLPNAGCGTKWNSDSEFGDGRQHRYLAVRLFLGQQRSRFSCLGQRDSQNISVDLCTFTITSPVPHSCPKTRRRRTRDMSHLIKGRPRAISITKLNIRCREQPLETHTFNIGGIWWDYICFGNRRPCKHVFSEGAFQAY